MAQRPRRVAKAGTNQMDPQCEFHQPFGIPHRPLPRVVKLFDQVGDVDADDVIDLQEAGAQAQDVSVDLDRGPRSRGWRLGSKAPPFQPFRKIMVLSCS